MSVKNILVAFNGSDTAIAALQYAASIAHGADTHVTALLAHAAIEDYATESRWIPPETRQIIARTNADVLDQIEGGFQELRAGLGLGERLHFQRAFGRVDAVLSECARNHDMIVVGRFVADGADSHTAVHPDRIALLSGRPVIVVPEAAGAKTEPEHTVLAWDGSRASARALSDCMQLLSQKGQLTILTVGDNATPRPVSELELHLSRHGIQANHVNLPIKTSVEDAILTYCQQSDPNLLAMGAYEHSKFREDFFGGVTSRIIERCSVPVLLSH